MASEVQATAPTGARVRGFFAPVDRATGTPTLWDAAGIAGFSLDAPPAPWIDLGFCTAFARSSGTKIEPVLAGAPAVAAGQVKTQVEAYVALEFESWGKLQLALTAGSLQVNVLDGQAPVAVGIGSSATRINVTGGTFAAGDIVAVDLDYVGGTGFQGAGISGAYISDPTAFASDTQYVRRVTLNVARVVAVNAGVLTLGSALAAGVPSAAMKVSKVVAFCDREGGSWFQEWSALFVIDGMQGDRVVFHYPRLQAMAGAADSIDKLAGLERMRLAGRFRALPVKDLGEMVVCFRSYLPAAMRAI
jgi:hypothetical protein